MLGRFRWVKEAKSLPLWNLQSSSRTVFGKKCYLLLILLLSSYSSCKCETSLSLNLAKAFFFLCSVSTVIFFLLLVSYNYFFPLETQLLFFLSFSLCVWVTCSEPRDCAGRQVLDMVAALRPQRQSQTFTYHLSFSLYFSRDMDFMWTSCLLFWVFQTAASESLKAAWFLLEWSLKSA